MITEAFDIHNNKVHINDTITRNGNEKYYLLEDKRIELIAKTGDKNEHHFALKESNGLSLWHRIFQEISKEYDCKTEVVIKEGDRRLDCLYDCSMKIPNFCINIEFQHSPMSPKEFNDRNNDYKNYFKENFTTVWIFDCTCEKNNIYKNDCFVFSLNTLENLENDDNLIVFLDTPKGLIRVTTKNLGYVVGVEEKEFRDKNDFFTSVQNNTLKEWKIHGRPTPIAEIHQMLPGFGKTSIIADQVLNV